MLTRDPRSADKVETNVDQGAGPMVRILLRIGWLVLIARQLFRSERLTHLTYFLSLNFRHQEEVINLTSSFHLFVLIYLFFIFLRDAGCVYPDAVASNVINSLTAGRISSDQYFMESEP